MDLSDRARAATCSFALSEKVPLLRNPWLACIIALTMTAIVLLIGRRARRPSGCWPRAKVGGETVLMVPRAI